MRFRLIAAGFALGAVAHAMQLIALLVVHVELLPGYPPWRHTVFAGIDSALAALALYAPRYLWLPLLALFGQQMTTHGVDAWRAWTSAHRIQWVSVVTLSFITWTTIVAVMEMQTHDRN